MKRWGRVAERKGIPEGWGMFDDVVSPSSAAVLAASTPFVDNVLGEIDDLLADRDFLIGFWQAPGE